MQSGTGARHTMGLHTHSIRIFVRTPVCLGWLCKAAAMSVAWFHSRVAFLQLLLDIVKNLIGISSESSQLFLLQSSGGWWFHVHYWATQTLEVWTLEAYSQKITRFMRQLRYVYMPSLCTLCSGYQHRWNFGLVTCTFGLLCSIQLQIHDAVSYEFVVFPVRGVRIVYSMDHHLWLIKEDD